MLHLTPDSHCVRLLATKESSHETYDDADPTDDALLDRGRL